MSFVFLSATLCRMAEQRLGPDPRGYADRQRAKERADELKRAREAGEKPRPGPAPTPYSQKFNQPTMIMLTLGMRQDVDERVWQERSTLSKWLRMLIEEELARPMRSTLPPPQDHATERAEQGPKPDARGMVECGLCGMKYVAGVLVPCKSPDGERGPEGLNREARTVLGCTAAALVE